MLKKITYAQALGRFRRLEPILLMPCNLNPNGTMGGTPTIHDEPLEGCFFESGRGIALTVARARFKKLLNHFSYYNCNEESGETISFYKES
jgi:hypothetical protein